MFLIFFFASFFLNSQKHGNSMFCKLKKAQKHDLSFCKLQKLEKHRFSFASLKSSKNLNFIFLQA
eukprot:UN00182